MAEHQNLQAAIRETRDLFKRRATAADWARNLIEGSRRLKTKKEWTKNSIFSSRKIIFEKIFSFFRPKTFFRK